MQQVDEKSKRKGKAPRNPARKEKPGKVYSMHDAAARKDGPDKQNWTKHDLVNFTPAYQRQADVIRAYGEGDDLALLGAAGVGKTVLSCYLAASSLVNREEGIDKIIVVRSAVPGRDQGFLPGTEAEKLEPYEDAYDDAFAVVFGHPSSYKHLKARGKVVFTSTSFKRGVNLRNAVVILEEVQNYNFQELHTLVTRLNETCRLIITGDDVQIDLGPRETSCIGYLRKMIPSLHRMYTTEFLPEESQRGQRVVSWLKAAAELTANKEKRNAKHD